MKIPDLTKMRVGRWVLIAAAILLTAANLLALIERADPPATEGVLDRYTSLIRDDEVPATQPVAKGEGAKSDQPKTKDPRVERICKRHLFSPDPPVKKFEATLTGVLGDTAYLDGSNAVQVGGDYKGAKLTAIGPDWATFDFEGSEQKLHVFGPGGGGPSPSGPPQAMVHRGPSSGPPRPPQGAPSGPPAGMRMPGPRSFPPEVLAAMKAKFATLSPEEKQKALERMPAEMREQLTK